jgi:GAF domain
MGRDATEFESLKTRVEIAIRKSGNLIQQTQALQARTTALLENPYSSEPMRFLPGNGRLALDWVVDSALRIANATKANVQVVDPASGVLRIAAQYGFEQAFLDYFDRVHEGEAACGKALRKRARVIIEDVTESEVFEGTTALEVLLDAGVRALQSTPLIGASGVTLGVLSTHWSAPRNLDKRILLQLDLLARTAANWLSVYATPHPFENGSSSFAKRQIACQGRTT